MWSTDDENLDWGLRVDPEEEKTDISDGQNN